MWWRVSQSFNKVKSKKKIKNKEVETIVQYKYQVYIKPNAKLPNLESIYPFRVEIIEGNPEEMNAKQTRVSEWGYKTKWDSKCTQSTKNNTYQQVQSPRKFSAPNNHVNHL